MKTEEEIRAIHGDLLWWRRNVKPHSEKEGGVVIGMHLMAAWVLGLAAGRVSGEILDKFIEAIRDDRAKQEVAK